MTTAPRPACPSWCRCSVCIRAVATSPIREWDRGEPVRAIAVEQPAVWGLLTGVTSSVLVRGRRPTLPPGAGVLLVAAHTDDDAFEAAIRAMLPAIRRSGRTVPWLRDLPVRAACGVARVIAVAPTARRGVHEIHLCGVEALPWALPLGVPGTGVLELAPGAIGESAIDLAWEVLLDGPRNLDGAWSGLVRAGFDQAWAAPFAVRALSTMARAEAKEQALRLAIERKRTRLAPHRRPQLAA